MPFIDQYLPEYQFSKVHKIKVNASADEVYKAVKGLNMGGSFFIRWLFRLRGLPGSAITLMGAQKMGFAWLGDNEGEELLLGLVGRFWNVRGHIQKIDKETFISFNKPGFAKTAWNFRLDQTGGNETGLSTETRILCTDEESLKKFQVYWFFIGPFSGLIRRKMLSMIKKDAENNT
jgi:hypothetical protein